MQTLIFSPQEHFFILESSVPSVGGLCSPLSFLPRWAELYCNHSVMSLLTIPSKIVLLRGMGYHSQKLRRLIYHCLCWGLPSLFVLVGITKRFYNSLGSEIPWCSIDSDWEWPLLYIPVMFMSSIGIVLMACSIVSIIKVRVSVTTQSKSFFLTQTYINRFSQESREQTPSILFLSFPM